jgi:CMP-N,N'-diacetyllegionaminic acid synthase
MSVLAIIPARGGSKGVKKKNLKLLAGVPLIRYPIQSAFKSRIFEKVVVTTDDQEIAAEAIASGAEVINRPSEISKDTSLVYDAIDHVLSTLTEKYAYTPQIIFLLEPTSPLRGNEDIIEANKILQSKSADSVATFKETKPSPGRIWKIENDVVRPYFEESNPFMPRQSQPKGYELTGEIYAFRYDSYVVNNSKSVLMGKVHPLISSSQFFVDIDEEVDFIFAESLIKYRNEKLKGTV